MVKALSAGCFKIAHLLPEPTSLFPRVRGIEMKSFIRQSNEI